MSTVGTPVQMPGGLTRDEIRTGKRKAVPRQRKARRLAMLPEDIKVLISNTPKKKRIPIQEETLTASTTTKECHTLNITVGDKIYQIETPPCDISFLEEHQSMTEVMTKFGEHAQMSDFLEEDIQEAIKGVMKYYMYSTTYPFQIEDLKMDLMFTDMKDFMLGYIDEQNLFGHWLYNHWDNIMYYFKLGFVAKDN